jgi:uncharacterized protein
MQAMDVLTITLTIAGAAALLNLWLAMRVSQLRIRNKVSIGDGGSPAPTSWNIPLFS